jgi:hypothetical protein
MSDALLGYLLSAGALSLFTTAKRTNVFPIMHEVGIRRELTEQHPWLPGAVLKAFEQSKAAALDKLADTSATKMTLPFVEKQLKAARESMGDDYCSYGVAPNRSTLETIDRHHHSQGLSARLAQLKNGRSRAFPEFYIKPNSSNAIFVRVHELPPSSPSFCPHPQFLGPLPIQN